MRVCFPSGGIHIQDSMSYTEGALVETLAIGLHGVNTGEAMPLAMGVSTSEKSFLTVLNLKTRPKHLLPA